MMLRAEDIVEMAKDAERYRWLRSHVITPSKEGMNWRKANYSEIAAHDRLVDAAMGKEQE